MQFYDLIMIAVLIGAMVFGAWKGLAWQLASLASLVVSYFVALQFSSSVAPYIMEREPANKFVAMLIIYVVCSLIIWGLFRLVSNMIDRIQLREFDRQMGALVGIAKGILLCVAITFFAVSLTEDPTRKSIMTSKSGYYIGYAIDQAHAVMPAEIHDVVHPYLHKLDEQLEHDHVEFDGQDGGPHDDHELPPAALPHGPE
ncbi:MAG: CvpA family protein [Pirellulales bacterium]